MKTKKEIRELRKKLREYSVKELKDLIVKLTPLKKAPFKYILERDNYSCRFCNRTEEIQVHHITPKSLGGDNHEYNLITLCKFCHIFIHCNPMSKINKSNLVKSAVMKIDGNTFSKNGKRWGRKALSKQIIEKVVELRKQGLSIRKIAEQVFYWDGNNNKHKISKSSVHKTLTENGLINKEEK